MKRLQKLYVMRGSAGFNSTSSLRHRQFVFDDWRKKKENMNKRIGSVPV